LSHRNKGDGKGKMPKPSARPRTVRRWRLRHKARTEPIVITGSHTHEDKK